MTSLWQYPFVNVFKHYSVGDWKKSSKEGDVSTIMDKAIKCTVYRVSGVIPANNFVQMPKTSTQSLGLTGRYFYLLFKPIPERYFVVHIDVASMDGLVIRISFSNLFKEFKSTSTWLQFPFMSDGSVSPEVKDGKLKVADRIGCASASTKWSILCLDLHYILSIYLNRTYSYLKSFRLCANILVKGIFTSENVYEPGMTHEESKKVTSKGILPLPKEMSYPLRRTEQWHDRYDFIVFPPTGAQSTQGSRLGADESSIDAENTTKRPPGVIGGSIKSPCRYPEMDGSTDRMAKDAQEWEGDSSHQPADKADKAKKTVVRVLREHNMHIMEPSAKKDSFSSKKAVRSSLKKVPNKYSTQVHEGVLSDRNVPKETQKSLLPDPILRLKQIIGFGGHTYGQVLWANSGDTIVYPCHAIVVALHVATGNQRFFVGHTDKISCMAMPHNSAMIASGQTGEMCLARIWNFESGECASLVPVAAKSLHSLSFSHEGNVLCGVGIDSHDHTVVITWNTSRALKNGEVVKLAKAHADFPISSMRICPLDEQRMISCGQGNIRVWRLKGTTLRSASVPLDACCDDDFTDICWSTSTVAQKHESTEASLERGAAAAVKAYTCTRSGYVFEVDPGKVSIGNSHRLLPTRTKGSQDKQTLSSGAGIAMNSIYVNATFCITGSDDGFLRIWPLDFKHVYLEAEHDGPVTVVQMSSSGLQVVAGTATGSIGILDLSTRKYTTVMRSHTDRILSLSIDPWHEHAATISVDCSIRVWDLKTGQQLYDFSALKECPTAVTYHPSQQSLACGFSSGFVRVFDISPTTVLAELSPHKGAVTGVSYSVDGERLYSCDSTGLLCMYDATVTGYFLMRNIGNTVAKGIKFGPNALAMSPQGSFLAFIGPQEFSVTVVSSKTLDEVMKIDITLMTSSMELTRGVTDAATGVFFTPLCASHLLVTTSNNRLLKFDATCGKLLEEVCDIHRSGCTAIDVTQDGQCLVTAGDRCLKVWDYGTCAQKNFQVFIGHSEIISRLLLTSNNKHLVSVAEAIFVWEYLGSMCKTNDHQKRALMEQNYFAKNDLDSQMQKHRAGFSTQLSSTDQDTDSDIPRPLLSAPHGGEHGAAHARDPDLSIPSYSSPSSPPTTAGNIMAGESTSRVDAGSSQTQQHVAGGAGVLTQTSAASGQPSTMKHFKARIKQGSFAQRRYTAPPGEAGIELTATFGYNGNGRKNLVWRPETGFFAYTCGCIVVVEDLKSGVQKHLVGHAEEISTVALQSDGLELASASGPFGLTKGQICVWDIEQMTCKRILSYHDNDVVAMAYSRDDRFLVTIGDYRDPCVVVWSIVTYSVMATAQAAAPVHDVLWDPFMMNEFCTVGDNPAAVLFWMVDEGQGRVSGGGDTTPPTLRVHDAVIPDNDELPVKDQSQASFTALCYAGDNVLYTGTCTGVITAWDTHKNNCFLHWRADSSEISVLVARKGRLISGTLGKKSLRLWNVSSVPEMTLPRDGSQHEPQRSIVMDDEMLLDSGVIAACFDDTLDMGIIGTKSGTLWYINWSDRSSVQIVTTNISSITAVELCNDGQYVTCAQDGSLRLWSIDEREQLLQFQVLGQSCLCAAMLPAAQKDSGVVRRQPSMYKDRQSTNQSSVAAGYSDGTIRVFDLGQADMVMKVQPHRHAIRHICFTSPTHMLTGDDGGYIAVTSMLTGMTTRVINDHKMASIVSFDVSQHFLSTSEDVLWLASSADRRVSIWKADWQKDKCELVDWLTFPALPISLCEDGSRDCNTEIRAPPSIARFSPEDSDIVVYVGYGLQRCIHLYSMSSQKVVREIPLAQWALSLDLSPQGHLIAVGVKERLLKLIDYNEGSFQDFVGHDDAVSIVKFTQSGHHLLSVVNDTVLFWKVLIS